METTYSLASFLAEKNLFLFCIFLYRQIRQKKKCYNETQKALNSLQVKLSNQTLKLFFSQILEFVISSKLVHLLYMHDIFTVRSYRYYLCNNFMLHFHVSLQTTPNEYLESLEEMQLPIFSNHFRKTRNYIGIEIPVK